MGLYGNLTKLKIHEPKKSERGLMKGKFANSGVLVGLFMQLYSNSFVRPSCVAKETYRKIPKINPSMYKPLQI